MAKPYKTTPESYVSATEYAYLADSFNPVSFDADAWMQSLKNSGMEYVTFGAKHHDGFSMWDSKHSDFDIGVTPWANSGTNPIEELAQAASEHDIKFGVYYSILDWHHPSFTENLSRPDMDLTNEEIVFKQFRDQAAKDEYIGFMKNQLTELLAYSPSMIWFDGQWAGAGAPDNANKWTHEDGQLIYDWLLQQDPDLIINNRIDPTNYKNREMISSSEAPAKKDSLAAL